MKRKIIIALISALVSIFITLAISYFAFVAFQKNLVVLALKSASETNDVDSVSISFFNSEIEGLKIAFNEDFNLSVEKISASHDFILKCLLLKTIVLSDLKIEGAKLVQNKPQIDTLGAKYTPLTQKQILEGQVTQTFCTPKIDLKNAPTTRPKQKTSNFLSGLTINIKNIEGDFECELVDDTKFNAKLNSQNYARNLILYDGYKLANLNMTLPISIQKNDANFNATLRVLATGTKKSSKILTWLFLDKKEIFKSEIKTFDFYKNFETQTQISFNSDDLKSLFQDLPQIALNLHSTASFNDTFKDANCKLSFRTDLQNLQEFSVYLDEVKTATLAGVIEFKKSSATIDVNKINFGLNLNDSNVCTLKSAKSFVLNTSQIANIPDGELFRLSFNKFNLNHINAFIRQTGLEVSSAPISTEILISKLEDKIEAKSEKLIAIKNFTFKKDANSIFNEASFNLFLSTITDFNQSKIVAQFTPTSKKSNFTSTLEFSFLRNFEKANFAIEATGNPSSLFPRAKACGVEKVDINAVALLNKNLLRIKKFATNLYGDANKNILSANIKNEICLDLTKNEISTQNAEIDISSSDMPSEILKAIYPNADAEKIALNANVKILNIENIEANISVDAKALTIANESGNLLENLALEANSKLIFRDEILDFDIFKFQILENATGILTGKANAKFHIGSDFSIALKNAFADLSASVPKLTQQPIFKKFDNASNGMLELKLNAQSKDKINADFTLSNLSTRGMPNLIEKAEFKNLLHLNGSNLSELQSNLRIATTKGESLINANLKLSDELILDVNSKKIIIEDIETIASAFQNKIPIQNEEGKTKLLRPRDVKNAKELPSASQIRTKIKHKLLPHETNLADIENLPEKQTEQSEIVEVKIQELPQEDTQIKRAIWDFNKTAKIKIFAQQIFNDGILILENLKADIFADKNSIKAQDVSFLFYGAPSLASCDIDFTQNGIYELKNSKLKIENLKLQKILKKNGEGRAFIEGEFNVDANFYASSNNLNDIANAMQFEATAKTQGGKMHILDRTSDTWEAASLGAGFLKLGGAIFGGKVKEVGDLTDIMDLLSTIEFSETTLNFRRDKNLNVELLPAKIKAQDALLSIRGSLNYMENESLLNMPIFIPIKLDATGGKLAYLLQKAGYKMASKSIVSGPEFQITGTLSKTKNNLHEILSKAVRSILKFKN